MDTTVDQNGMFENMMNKNFPFSDSKKDKVLTKEDQKKMKVECSHKVKVLKEEILIVIDQTKSEVPTLEQIKKMEIGILDVEAKSQKRDHKIKSDILKVLKTLDERISRREY